MAVTRLVVVFVAGGDAVIVVSRVLRRHADLTGSVEAVVCLVVHHVKRVLFGKIKPLGVCACVSLNL